MSGVAVRQWQMVFVTHRSDRMILHRFCLGPQRGQDWTLHTATSLNGTPCV